MSFTFLQDISLDTDQIHSDSYQFPFLYEHSLTNGIIIDLFRLAKGRNNDLAKSLVNWICRLRSLQSESINAGSSMSRIYRLVKLLKSKRGQDRVDFLQEVFHVSFVSAETVSAVPRVVENQDIAPPNNTPALAGKLNERRKKVRSLQEEKKCLKRKYSRLFKKQVDSKQKIHTLNENVKQLTRDLRITKTKCRKYDKNLKRAKDQVHHYLPLIITKNREIKALKERISSDERKLEIAQKAAANSEADRDYQQILDLQKKISEQNKYIYSLESLLDDEQELFDKTTKSYTPELVECVKDLTTLKVPATKVGKVIKSVAKLCGKVPDCLPSTTTILRIMHSKDSSGEPRELPTEESNTNPSTDDVHSGPEDHESL